MNKKPIMLTILDGFGIKDDKYYNGVLNSHMKNYFSLWNNYPHTRLHASGPLVGLPDGQIGSSEVGHMTIGAGRLIKQPLVRITEEIESKKFFSHKKLLEGIKYIEKSKGNIHIMGLLSNGGVHSSDIHLHALLDFYNSYAEEIEGKIFIHNFLDGRDTPQKSAIGYIEELENKINSLEHKDKFIISTICGRYYAMDRDERWERTKLAYDMLINGVGKKTTSAKKAIEESYKQETYDEFLMPTILHIKPIKNNDLCIFYNFRSDRPKQIVDAIINPEFKEFETKKLKNLKFQTLTNYSPNFKVDVLYPTIYPTRTFGEIIAKSNLKQLRIAESEKYPHITYFFNGLKNEPFKNETRIKILSPKVATYDLQPEMNAPELTKKVIEAIKENQYDFILLNYANSDMVGHTGNYEAVIKAMKEVDKNLGLIKTEIDKLGGTLLITADHGNCETMRDEKDNPHTKHTYNLVPFILCDKSYKLRKDYENLSLYNIAPTLLELLNIKQPKIMDKSIIEK
ncbi:MAG: 2,3-bisphosphoglycerate-independent phosphoglycerate mutase [Candidatus Woesearchaeota archaeon]|jgi:2,3-bisphosphoglycerate-independent phosphoglycerate mutase|nr:2,3-bisphosphoglycerate-independent phosphoglycerate mutase [Candidatus Woesearchaeota archaeon]